ncbi:diaminopimelate decarboxylase [Enterococcus sp. CWB-B31]|uniref:diaminopimelate decarboxylase n=1 Tax=Enterococcus sp. CWB-B31 TaxID=2885159 RepID=UPI001E647493|nr:diaminopimelate decarboxylase [Enterococcus sp. CWB-B31]MCB5955989.1 diaminopimelate decarboxylase [Enterococcus sp. CWB-B31]
MSLLFGTAEYNEKNHLAIGGCDTTELAEKYGTPLFIYDVAQIREKARGFKKTLDEMGVKNKVVYASKAFSCLAVYKLLEEENLGCDVVSGGELYTALKGGMNPDNIEFHGNNKTKEELEFALDSKIGMIIIDNFYELELLKELTASKGVKQAVMLRITPGVNAETHEFILTGQVDSKFGFDVNSGQAEKALATALEIEGLDVKGIHCHIGSQIFSSEGFIIAVEKMMAILQKYKENYGYIADILNMGGGFGVKYVESDTPLKPEQFVQAIVEAVKGHCAILEYPLPEIWIEPGRNIVAEAGTTLYKVGSQKVIPDIRHYVSVDGGMGDNIRPALYDAVYTAALANRVSEGNKSEVALVGKYCESGDVLIKSIELPDLVAGDLLAMSSTGAYGYSMANNYNRNPRPAVIFVEDGKDTLVVRRETYEDLISLDCEV